MQCQPKQSLVFNKDKELNMSERHALVNMCNIKT